MLNLGLRQIVQKTSCLEDCVYITSRQNVQKIVQITSLEGCSEDCLNYILGRLCRRYSNYISGRLFRGLFKLYLDRMC